MRPLNLGLRAGTEAGPDNKGQTVRVSRTASRPTWWWFLAVLSALSTSASIVLLAHDGAGAQEIVAGPVGFSAVMALTYPFVGAALRARVPGNRLSAVLFLTGLSRAVSVPAFAWAGGMQPLGAARDGVLVAAWLANGLPLVALALAPLSLLWFPDGRLPDARRRWRVAQGSTPIALSALVVLMALTWRYRGPALLDESSPPGGLQGHLAVLALLTCIVGALAGLVAGIASLFARWRRNQGVVRQQLKWYLVGAALAIVLNVSGDIVPGGTFLNLLGTLCIEASILIAVVKHDLWDIDRILKRTVVYGGLTAVLAATYVGGVVALGLLLDDLSRGHGVAIAAATLAATTVAGPARRSLQRSADRRFDRRAFDAVAQIEQHASRASVRPPIPGETEALLANVLRDPSLRVLYRCRDGLVVDAWGRARPAGENERLGAESTMVGEAPNEIGLLVHRGIEAHEAALWAAVLRAAKPSLSQCRLQAEVMVQVAAVERSRSRIVEAADSERRRIERNLHDGAQQRLVSLALRLRTEQRRHAGVLGPEAGRIIDEAVEELRGSVDELRALAAGLLPGSLVSEGLGPALEEMAVRHPHGVRVRNVLDHRHARSVDEVAWFVAAEGISNAVKHASQAQVSLDVACGGGHLTLVVSDDGCGGAIEGAGLIGLQDRVRACSGVLTLSSPVGRGTTLRLVLPCG